MSLSNLLGMACCRFHDDRTPSMGIYENTGEGRTWYTYFCFGCKATGLVPRSEVSTWLSDAARITDTEREEKEKRQENLWRDTIPVLAIVDKDYVHDEDKVNQTIDFLSDRGISLLYADAVGVRYHIEQHALMWQCLRHDGGVQAIQLRYIQPPGNLKIITYPHPDEKQVYPKYAVINSRKKHEVGQVPWLIISESYLDGLALHEHTGSTVFTSLSANFNQRHVGIINLMASESNIRHIILAYDMDEAGQKAEVHMSRHLTSLGFFVIRMSKIAEHVAVCFVLKPYHKIYTSMVADIVKSKSPSLGGAK